MGVTPKRVRSGWDKGDPEKSEIRVGWGDAEKSEIRVGPGGMGGG